MSTDSVVEVRISNGDFIRVTREGDKWKLMAAPCSQCLELLEGFKKLQTPPWEWELPALDDGGKTDLHSRLLLRELILKMKNQWNPPYAHVELCHCRAITTETVEQAILKGCHTFEEVSLVTSAATACGTCKPDVQKTIDYRLGRVLKMA